MLERLTSSFVPVPTRATRVNPLGLLGFAALIFAAARADASALTPGNIVVLRVGDGTAALSGAASAVFLDEYNAAGTLVQTLPLPTAVSGANQPLTNSGSATSEGFLGLSTDGAYLVQGGYSAVPGTAGVAATTATAVPRVIGRIDLNGNIDTSTVLNDMLSFSGSNIRSVASINGTAFWAAGTASSGANGGVRYVPGLGPNGSTQLSATPTNTRVVNIFAGQLYVSSASGAFLGVSTVGTGIPTTSGQTTTLIAGQANESAYDYFLADPSTMYIADDRTTTLGGVQKWTFNGTVWSLAYTLNPPTFPASASVQGCRGLTGTVAGGAPVLYATTTSSQIVRVIDTGATSTFTLVATSTTNTAFRGVRLLPVACTSGLDCNLDGVSDSCDIAFGISRDLNSNGIPDGCEQNGGTPYCFGDGSSGPCPCGNNTSIGVHQGCSHGFGGAALVGSGTTSVSADSLVLAVSNLQQPAGNSGTVLFFQGDAQVSATFNDGLRCVGGNQVRLGPKLHLGTTASYPEAGDPSVSVRGGIPAAGGAYDYQCWYRTFPTVCGMHSNLSNGLSVVWTP